MRPVVAWDIDDVIYPWSETAHRACVAAKLGSANEKTVPMTWDHHTHYGVDADAWYGLLAEITLNGELYGQEPDTVALQVIADLDRAGVEQHFITARGFMQHAELIREQTEAMFVKHVIPHASLTFTRDKGAEARRLGITHSIDDNVGNYEAFMAAGVDSYLKDFNHNRTYVVPSARRITDLWQFARIIKRGSAAA